MTAEEQAVLLQALVEALDALAANGVFHTPVAMRRLGRPWDEYEADAITRTRDARLTLEALIPRVRCSQPLNTSPNAH